MKHKFLRLSAMALSAALFSAGASAQITLVKEGKSTARIVLADRDSVNRTAATLLQDFVQRISGASLPIVTDTKEKPGDILIGKGNTDGLTEDGFRLSTEQGKLRISSGGDKGVIYGVVTLLEDYMGVEYLTANTSTSM